MRISKRPSILLFCYRWGQYFSFIVTEAAWYREVTGEGSGFQPRPILLPGERVALLSRALRAGESDVTLVHTRSTVGCRRRRHRLLLLGAASGESNRGKRPFVHLIMNDFAQSALSAFQNSARLGKGCVALLAIFSAYEVTSLLGTNRVLASSP